MDFRAGESTDRSRIGPGRGWFISTRVMALAPALSVCTHLRPSRRRRIAMRAPCQFAFRHEVHRVQRQAFRARLLEFLFRSLRGTPGHAQLQFLSDYDVPQNNCEGRCYLCSW